MALAAILLPIIWILQILIFNLPDAKLGVVSKSDRQLLKYTVAAEPLPLQDQLDVLRGSILSGLLLLFALELGLK